MLDVFAQLAYGPIGGIDPSIAVKWVVLWTVVLGGLLYGSVVFFPQWVDMSDVEEPPKH